LSYTNSSIDNDSNKPLDLSGHQDDLDNANSPNISKVSETISKVNQTSTGISYHIQENAANFPSRDESSPWSPEKLKEKLYLQLISIKTNKESKYEKQARELIYKIPVYHPTPYFIINQSDLSPRLIEELAELDDTSLDAVIKEVISWIYEPINIDYFLLSIKRRGLIRWEIEQ
jgi:hypothetical protein